MRVEGTEMQVRRYVPASVPSVFWPRRLSSTIARTARPRTTPTAHPMYMWSQLAHQPVFMLSASFLGIVLVCAALAPLLAPYDPSYIDLASSQQPPSWAHPMGTDRLGRDILSRILHGSRVTIGVATTAALLAGTLGTVTGAVAGYFGGRVDSLLMRGTDLMLALPTFFILVAAQAILGPSLPGVILIIALTGWMSAARIVRGQFMSLTRREFVEAARAVGCGPWRIVFRHILPNASSQVVVLFTLSIADAVLVESALSFLGLGMPSYQPSWGNMLTDGQVGILSGGWWIAFFPGLMILLTALSINLIGDYLQDALRH